MKLTLNKGRKLFFEYLTESGYKKNTIQTKMYYLKLFIMYTRTYLNLNDIRDIKDKDIREYLKWVESVKSNKGDYYTLKTKKTIFLNLQLFFKALYIKEEILINPVIDIKYRPTGEVKEKVIFTESEIEGFLDFIDGKSYLNKRDRAMFELMYSSGLRSGEVANIKLSDINFEDSLIHIRLGKFGKDRIVPVSDTAMVFLKNITKGIKYDRYIFRSIHGLDKLSVRAINKNFKKYLKLSGIDKKGATAHSIRHSTATHLLDRGANIRYVQSLLGHESVETTTVYTHLLTNSLKRVYKSHHPRENDYFEEVDSIYLNELDSFKNTINRQRKIRERRNQNVTK